MKTRTRLMRLRQSMYRRLAHYARSFFGRRDSRLARYASAYQREFSQFEGPSSKAELLEAILSADIVFCGDYHTLARAQRTIHKLMESVVPRLRRTGRSIVLGLEMLRARDSSRAAQFLDGDLSEAAFLKAIDFERNWGFEWESYRPFFEMARREQFSVVGINRLSAQGKPALKARDRFAAKIVADLTEKHAKSLIMVVAGDLHLARQHLPGELERELVARGLKRRVLVIHQNLDKFFWTLVEKGLEEVEVLKIRSGVFCVMSAAPWVKLRSQIRWAELTADEGEEPTLSATEAAEEVGELASDIARFIGIELQTKGDFEVWAARAMRPKGVQEKEFARRCLKEFESLFIPAKNLILMPRPSLNQAAACAALYLHVRASGSVWGYLDILGDFHAHVWREALAFFGSKIVNPKRLCYGPQDLRKIVEARRGPNVRVAESALKHWSAETRGKGIRRPGHGGLNTQVFYYKVAKLLGRRLGYGLYAAVVDNQVTRVELQELFETRFTAGRSRRLYREMIARLDQRNYRDVVRQDRL